MTDNQAERPFKVFHEVSIQENAEPGPCHLCRVRWHERHIGRRIKTSSLRMGLLAMSLFVLAACQATGEQACGGEGYQANSPGSGDCGAGQSEAWSQRALEEAQGGFDRRSPRDR